MLLEDGFAFGFPMNEKVKISIFTFSDLIPIMTSKWYITLTHYYDYVDNIENNFLIFLNIILVGLWNATRKPKKNPSLDAYRNSFLRVISVIIEIINYPFNLGKMRFKDPPSMSCLTRKKTQATPMECLPCLFLTPNYDLEMVYYVDPLLRLRR
jgi:hypothetical protein